MILDLSEHHHPRRQRQDDDSQHVILLAGLFAVFLGMCLVAELDWRFAAASVAVTWFAGFGFVAMVGEQLFWTTRARRLAG